MGIKFFGEPFKEIKSKLTGKVAFRFDSKGEFITDDPEIIRRATGYFDHVPVKIEEVGERVAKTFIVPPLTITTKDQEEETASDRPESESAKFNCKHCGEKFSSWKELMDHYREHKKEGQS
jgi:hypothetical protein